MEIYDEKYLLKQLIKENVERTLLYEGLIYSYSPSFIIQRLKNFELNGFSYDKKRNVFYMEFKLGLDNVERYEHLNNFLDNICGWFHGSTIYNKSFIPNKKDFLSETSGIATLQYEAKFDVEIEKAPKELFHLTRTKSLDKILKSGLTPKASTKFFNYKDRIYFSTDLEPLVDLALQKNIIENDNEFVFLRINGAKLNYGIRFFKDPNFINGVYTLENVSKSAIEPYAKLHIAEDGSYKIEEFKTKSTPPRKI